MMNRREEKKDHILLAGLEVMKSHGYNGTSVKDIVDAADVPKGSFYNYFESKEAFALEALEKVAQDAWLAASHQLVNTSSPPLERLEHFFAQGADFAIENDFKVGCFFGNMCQEMAESNEVIRTKVRHIMKRKTRLLSDVLDEAKQDGMLPESTDTSIMAEFLFNAWEGALMRMKASRCREPLDAFLLMLPHLTKR